MTPYQLRDELLAGITNVSPRSKILIPWIKGHRQVTGFHFDEDGNMVLDVESLK